MIPTPAVLPGPFTGLTPFVRSALSLMVFHFLWRRNKHLTVSMVMNIWSLKKHLVSVFDFKAAGLQGTHHPTQVHSIPWLCCTQYHALESKNQERLAKHQQLKQLREQIYSLNYLSLQWSSTIYLFPTEEACHVTHLTHGAHLMAQRINSTVAQKISELVGQGVIEPQEIKRALNHVNIVIS